MKNLIHLILLVLPVTLAAQDLPTISRMDTRMVEFTVADPDGQPVEGALLEASRPGPGNAAATTGRDGKVRLELTAGATLYVYVSKDGYYTTGGELWRGGMHKGPDRRLVPRIVPDSFDIVLKPVLDPVPMKHVQYTGFCPMTGQPVPFDLSVGDWVSPLGKGEVPDIYFNFQNLKVSSEAYSGVLTLLFPNYGDGIQSFEAARPHSMAFGSNLAPPNKAPLEGYDRELRLEIAWKQGDRAPFGLPTTRNYIIRTRTVRGPDGSIAEACYGWILGEIEFDPRGRPGPQLKFEYSFNEDPDPRARSLEDERNVP